MNDPKPTKGEVTRQAILQAAYELFISHGYHATSMRQIVQHAGITMGGIYNHFPSKESIWIEVLRARHPYHELLPLLKTAQGDTIEEYAHSAATRMIEGLGMRRDLFNLLFIELVEFKAVHLAQVYEDMVSQLAGLHAVFEAKKGNLRPYPLPFLIRSFASMIFAYYVTELIMPPQARALMTGHSLDDFIDIYLHGALEPSGEERHA